MTLAILTFSKFIEKLQHPLVLFGFIAQGVFMLRFVVQWLASERKGRSVMPIAFWYISCLGGVMLFSYALLNDDPVIMFGQILGLSIYVRNLVLIHRERTRIHRRSLQSAAATAREPHES